jgi:hypothetical protein
MSKLTFVVGIKRRKIDEYRPEALFNDDPNCPGRDRRRRADRRTALIYPEGESSSSFSFSFRLLSISQKTFAILFTFVFL